MADRPPIAPLHGLRALAALTVLVGHVLPWAGYPGLHLAPSIGVVLFFVLSGYLLGRLYLSEKFTFGNVARYVVARVARVYPLFAVVVVAAALPSIWLNGRSPFGVGFDRVLEHLGLAGSGTTIWTIAVEFRFYLLFIPLWLGFSLLTRNRLLLASAFVLSVVALLWLTGMTGDRLAMNRYLHLFLLGMLGALVGERATGWRTAAAAVLPISLGMYVASFFVVPMLYDQELVYGDIVVSAGVLLLVLAAVEAPTSTVGRVLSARPLVWLGEVSFGVYLLHRPVMFAFKELGLTALSGAVLVATVFGATIAIAAFANIVIEKPARTAIRNLGDAVIGKVGSRLVRVATRDTAAE